MNKRFDLAPASPSIQLIRRVVDDLRRYETGAAQSSAFVLLLLAAALWTSRYWYSAEFGLYEDDYTRTPRAMFSSLPELVHLIGQNFQQLSEHGKALQAPLLDIFSFLGARLGGLRGAYLLGFGLTLWSAWLFYTLLQRVATPLVALLGALAFSLFCADTTQAWLTRSFGLQPALILLLLAFHDYPAAHPLLKLRAYGLAFLILLVYETPFPVFLAAPLFWQQRANPFLDRRWLKEFVRHALILGAGLVFVVVIRWLAGEERVSGLDGANALLTPLTHMLSGPWTSLKVMLSRPYQVARNLKPEMAIALAASIPVFTWMFWRSAGDHAPMAGGRQRWNALMAEVQPLGRLLISGLVMLALAYPLTFTIDPHVVDGRDSRVHLAAVLGVSLCVACAGGALVCFARHFLKKILAAIVLAVYFGLLLGYGFVIQGDYALAWQMQREFWTQLTPLIADARDGTVILVEPSVPRAVGQIGVITWSTPRVLVQLVEYPADWQSPPRVYRLEPGWEQYLGDGDGQFLVNAQTSFIPETMFETLESTDVIFIETGDSGLLRRTAPLRLNEQDYPLKQPGDAGVAPYPRKPLADWLIWP